MMSPRVLAIKAIIGGSLLVGCQTTPTVKGQFGAADAATVEAVSKALNKALDRQSIKLTPPQISGQSTIAVPPKSLARENGRILDGRSMAMPILFDVMTNGNTCYVVNRKTGEQYPLDGVNCGEL